MKRWLICLCVVTTFIAIVGESQSEARGLKRCRAVRCEPSCTMSWDPCCHGNAVHSQADPGSPAVQPGQPAANPSATAEPRKMPTESTKPAEAPKPTELPNTKPSSGETEGTKPPAAVVKVQALLIVDDAAKTAGPSAAASAKLMSASLAAGLGKGVNITLLRGGDVSSGKIIDIVRGLTVDSDDALIVYMVGPGAYDESAKDFVFNTSGGALMRNQLKAAALAKKARLTVLLTDPVAYGVAAEPLKPEIVSTEAPTLLEVLGRFKGIVDIHGCSVGEEAFARGDLGGCFTLSLVRELSRSPHNWLELVDHTKAGTDQLYKDARLEVLKSDAGAAVKKLYRDQESQTPVVLTPLDQISMAGTISSYMMPPTMDPTFGQPADITATVPEDATLFIDGEPSSQMSVERTFQTPPLEMGKRYTYQLRISLVRGGREWVATQKATVRSGEAVNVTFDMSNLMMVGR